MELPGNPFISCQVVTPVTMTSPPCFAAPPLSLSLERVHTQEACPFRSRPDRNDTALSFHFHSPADVPLPSPPHIRACAGHHQRARVIRYVRAHACTRRFDPSALHRTSILLCLSSVLTSMKFHSPQAPNPISPPLISSPLQPALGFPKHMHPSGCPSTLDFCPASSVSRPPPR